MDVFHASMLADGVFPGPVRRVGWHGCLRQTSRICTSSGDVSPRTIVPGKKMLPCEEEIPCWLLTRRYIPSAASTVASMMMGYRR